MSRSRFLATLLAVGALGVSAAPGWAATPNTTITSGPSGTIATTSATFEFSSNVDSATFQCKIDTKSFKACASPKSYSNLSEGVHKFRVRAKKGSSVDQTPAARNFTIELPLTNDLDSARAAAKFYFPNTEELDAPPVCIGDPMTIECVEGTPVPASDQLSISSARNIVPGTEEGTYDATITSNIQPLQTVLVHYISFGCDVLMESENGESPAWTVDFQLQYADPEPGEPYFTFSDLSVDGVERFDWGISGPTICATSGFWDTELVIDAYEMVLNAHMTLIGERLCASPGPAYLRECPDD